MVLPDSAPNNIECGAGRHSSWPTRCPTALIEGPMGGIWSWTIDDVGHAATWPHQHSPEALLR